MSSAPDEPPLAVGSLLRRAWLELTNENYAQLHAAGFDDLRVQLRPVFREMVAGNLRPSELAARLNISKQAANDFIREFEAKGYITLEPDPDDGRARRIVATARGREAYEVGRQASDATGRRWAEQVGAERYAIFEQVLREIVEGAPGG